MKTKIEPWGVVLTIRHENKTYHGIIQNDFTLFSTFGNYNLSTDTLILFDEDFNKLSFSEENTKETCKLYDLFEELIETIVVEQQGNDDDDEEDV